MDYEPSCMHMYLRLLHSCISSTSGKILLKILKTVIETCTNSIQPVLRTFFKSSTPPSAAWRRSTNLEVSRPRDFSWRPPWVGEDLPPSSVSVSDIYSDRLKIEAIGRDRSRKVRPEMCLCISSASAFWVSLQSPIGESDWSTRAVQSCDHNSYKCAPRWKFCWLCTFCSTCGSMLCLHMQR